MMNIIFSYTYMVTCVFGKTAGLRYDKSITLFLLLYILVDLVTTFGLATYLIR